MVSPQSLKAFNHLVMLICQGICRSGSFRGWNIGQRLRINEILESSNSRSLRELILRVTWESEKILDLGGKHMEKRTIKDISKGMSHGVKDYLKVLHLPCPRGSWLNWSRLVAAWTFKIISSGNRSMQLRFRSLIQLKYLRTLYTIVPQLIIISSNSQNPELYIRLPDKDDDINSSEEC